MDIKAVKEGMIVGTEEKIGGRNMLAYGTILNIDQTTEEVVVSIVGRNGESGYQRTFNVGQVWPIHSIIIRKNQLIGRLLQEKRILEGLIVSLARGKVPETSVQEMLEFFIEKNQAI